MKQTAFWVILTFILITSAPLFSEYVESENGDWAWIGKEKPPKTTTKKPQDTLTSFTGDSKKPATIKTDPLVITNRIYSFIDLCFRYNRPLFADPFGTLEAYASFMHIPLSRKLYKASFSWIFQITEEKIMEHPDAYASYFKTLGFSASFLYGHPLSCTPSRNTVQLVTFDIGGGLSIFGDNAKYAEMNPAFIAEARTGLRFLISWSEKSTIFAHFSIYLHLAIQYGYINADVFSPYTATPDTSIYSFRESGIQPELIIGMETKFYMITFNTELLVLNGMFSGFTFGLGLNI